MLVFFNDPILNVRISSLTTLSKVYEKKNHQKRSICHHSSNVCVQVTGVKLITTTLNISSPISSPKVVFWLPYQFNYDKFLQSLILNKRLHTSSLSLFCSPSLFLKIVSTLKNQSIFIQKCCLFENWVLYWSQSDWRFLYIFYYKTPSELTCGLCIFLIPTI